MIILMASPVAAQEMDPATANGTAAGNALKIADEKLATLNSESIELFIDIFPRYRKMIDKMGSGSPLGKTIQTVMKDKAEIEAIFKERGITFTEFGGLTTKIMSGLKQVNMEENNMDPRTSKIANLISLSDEEIAAVKKYKDTLNDLFETAAEKG